ncbi:hypothetical protein Y71_02160 [Kosakonia radicincitans DSM 16656]|uniref:DnaJ homologue subfamily C member 28 conserved domain-containing protein n=1 Tax=Kosakonia radicincitans TaxID=283686 RepID=A0AAX2F0J1_9ENTR|nr:MULTISPECIES: DUF1992 domain-containing protein [Kosakonia]MDP9569510.1 hypothetical protein [Kosakonia oryzae]APG20197.1 hypothetical protein A3780_22525 [Kosakonia radicincitans]ARD58779.1 hypothetical protein Y71_02160 [Kosakonia radicincitans DSM 16656]KDE33145.1 hypothetical protein AW40_29305 [Kosakonia radicincitans UMEnt01/12]MDD7998443.1 DUF1992 domain-containing protein [Kosakonia radicincitans]
MWLLDQWAERHILDAQNKGEFDSLPGSGEPLTLDDDSHVPPELRAGYRLLKNAGCLPPELEYRREAIALADLLNGVQENHPQHRELQRRLSLLELKLRQAGLSTDFLRGDYATKLLQKLNEE